MARLVWVFALLAALTAARPARADDLPPGALVRLGDDRFRAGCSIHHLALSPDGKQFATARDIGEQLMALTVWDAETGQPLREQRVNAELFKGLAWGKAGAFAVVVRADVGAKEGEPGTLTPDDFRVWDFTDPKSAGPPLLALSPNDPHVHAKRPEGSPEYTEFLFSGDGNRLAAKWRSGDGKKHAVHIFDLKPADRVAKLPRAGTIDLGAEGADEMSLSADGKTLVTFRALSEPFKLTATAWDVAEGKPAKPVLTPNDGWLIPAPGARGVVLLTEERNARGFDYFDLTTGTRRKLNRRHYTTARLDEGVNDAGVFAFMPGGRELVAAIDRRTFVIDLEAGKELGRFEGHAFGPSAVAVSADGARIATADVFGLVRLWDAKTFRPLNDAPGHRAPVEHAELSPDGKRLLTWAPDETVRLWDLATGKELRAFTGAVAPRGSDGGRPTFTPDGTAVLYATKDRLVARDLQTGLEAPLPGEMAKLKARFAVFSPDGNAVLTWAGHVEFPQAPCAVWDWPSGKERFEFGKEAVGLIAPGFSPDGSAVYYDQTSPQRWGAKAGKVLPPAWKDGRTGDPLLALRPNPRLLLDIRGDLPRVIEAGTGKVASRYRLAQHRVNRDAHSSLLWGIALSPAEYAWAWPSGWSREPFAAYLSESATHTVRRELRGHRGEVRVLGFTPDGAKLLTAGGDHTVLVWDVRLQSVPLPEAVKKETSAAKLWDTLAAGNAKDAYLAMARLARDPDAALKIAAMRLKPATKVDPSTDASQLADARAVELLEAIGTDAARSLLKELAGGHAGAFRTQEAKRALERNAR
jgi:WD40 repeat protein